MRSAEVYAMHSEGILPHSIWLAGTQSGSNVLRICRMTLDLQINSCEHGPYQRRDDGGHFAATECPEGVFVELTEVVSKALGR